MEIQEIMSCRDCGTLAFRSDRHASNRLVPGSADSPHAAHACDWVHSWESIGQVNAGMFVHLAMSTLLRRGDLEDWRRTGIHRVQSVLGYGPRVRALKRHGWPSRIIKGYDVTPDGLAMARHMARDLASSSTATSQAYLWRQAAGLLGVILP